jgi:HEAT repeat protein
MKDLLAELTSGDDERAENRSLQLQIWDRRPFPLLLELTRSEDIRFPLVGCTCTCRFASHTDFDLLPLLSDSSPEVRAATALALCHHPHEDAVEALIHALADEDTLTAGLAGNALVKIGSPSVPTLLKVMDEAPTGIRIVVLRTLSEIRDHRAIPIMMKCLGEESAFLQYWAQEGLERLGLDMVYMKP